MCGAPACSPKACRSTRSSSSRPWATMACASAPRSRSCSRATACRPGSASAIGSAPAFFAAAFAPERMPLARDGLPSWLGQRYRLDTVYLGRDFDRDIDAALGAVAGLRRQAGAPLDGAVERIAAGQVGAAYLGRMEFGPRALGARSILASPADHAINDDLNSRLERSEFMPFAPYVLDEHADEVFEITPVNRYAARFMTITCGV